MVLGVELEGPRFHFRQAKFRLRAQFLLGSIPQAGGFIAESLGEKGLRWRLRQNLLREKNHEEQAQSREWAHLVPAFKGQQESGTQGESKVSREEPA